MRISDWSSDVCLPIWTALGRRGLEPSAPAKFGLAMIQLGAGFLVLVAGASAFGMDNLTPVVFVFLIYLLHTTGELCLWPVALSALNRLPPAQLPSPLKLGKTSCREVVCHSG